jgi:transposase
MISPVPSLWPYSPRVKGIISEGGLWLYALLRSSMRGASREFTFGVFSSSPLGWSRLALVKSSWGRGVPGVFLERVKNLGSRTVAFGYGCSKSVPKRCLRRRVGVLGAPYLALLREEAPQRERTICARSSTGSEVDREHRDSPWRYMPHDLPRWEALYKQRWRWIRAGLFEEMVHDLRVLLRLSAGRAFDSTATILDSRTLRSTPESGSRGGYSEHKPKKGSKVHAAVDTWGHLLALRVSRANEDDRKEVVKLFGGDPGSHPKVNVESWPSTSIRATPKSERPKRPTHAPSARK